VKLDNNFNLDGLYADDDGNLLGQPGAFGLFTNNRTHINMQMKFTNP